MWYEHKNINKSSKDFLFLDGHPGHKAVHLQKKTDYTIPIIKLQKPLPDMRDLRRGVHNVSEDTLELREYYAQNAMIMFVPFRSIDDLKGNSSKSYWETFERLISTKKIWSKGLEVLQNIQERKDLDKLGQNDDYITRNSTLNESLGLGNKHTKGDEDDGNYFNIEEIEDLLDDGSDENDILSEDITLHNKYTHDNITSKHKILPKYTANAQLENKDVIENTKNYDMELESIENAINENYSWRTKPALLEFIAGVLICDDIDDCLEHNSDKNLSKNNHLDFNKYAKKYTLDKIQIIAYEKMCLSFIMKCLKNCKKAPNFEEEDCLSHIGTIFGKTNISEYTKTMEFLVEHGANDQLCMFLTGAAGSGKSRVIQSSREFCHHFCKLTGFPFDKNSVYITATIGSAASLLGGDTTDGSVHLMKKRRLTDFEKDEFNNCYLLIVDELSYFSKDKLIKMDKQLRTLMREPSQPYGGLNIVFVGDFHQIEAFSGDVIYKNWFTQWHSVVNCVLTLQNDHRFEKDPEYGHLLKRLREGKFTKEDVDTINTRWLGDPNVQLPQKSEQLAYACSTNAERNGISTGIFSDHVENTHPRIDEDKDTPIHTIIIESSLRNVSSKTKCTPSFHKFIYEHCGDNDTKTSSGSKVDPALKFYSGIPLMINSNNDLKKGGRGNGTLCRGISLKLKKDCFPTNKIGMIEKCNV